MAGNSTNKRRFSVERRTGSPRGTDDLEVVLAGDFAHRASVPLDIPIEQIDPSPFQMRRSFDNLEELAAAMRVHGFTSRLMVRSHPTEDQRYQLVYGERRLRAARLAGIRVIPCDMTQFSDRDLLEIGLTENLQRADLNPLEEAQGLRHFMDEFGYTIRDMAERIGKSKGYIDNRIGLLRVPEDVQEMVKARADTVASAPIIAKVATAKARRPLIEGLTKGMLTAADIRTIANDSQAPPNRMATRPQTSSADKTHLSQAPMGKPSTNRQSERALQRVTHSLDSMMAQLRDALPQLQSKERGTLLTYIVQTHFASLEALVVTLREEAS
ncbi:MAG: hypothetical protein NVS2B7_18000 [Herpetosiphon sp.]